MKTLEVIRLFGLFGRHQAGSVYSVYGLAPTLDTMSGGYRQPLIIVNEDNYVKEKTL